MTLPNLKQYIYSALGVGGTEIEEVEGRLNIMQTTFLTLQISPDLSQDEKAVMNGQDVFRALFTRHFDENVEASCVELCVTLFGNLEWLDSVLNFSLTNVSIRNS